MIGETDDSGSLNSWSQTTLLLLPEMSFFLKKGVFSSRLRIYNVLFMHSPGLSAVFYISNQAVPPLPQLEEAAFPQCSLRLLLEKVSQLLLLVTLIC